MKTFTLSFFTDLPLLGAAPQSQPTPKAPQGRQNFTPIGRRPPYNDGALLVGCGSGLVTTSGTGDTTSAATEDPSSDVFAAIRCGSIVLSPSAVSSSQINLSWTDPCNNEKGFQVQQALSSTGPFTNVCDVGPTSRRAGLTASPLRRLISSASGLSTIPDRRTPISPLPRRSPILRPRRVIAPRSPTPEPTRPEWLAHPSCSAGWPRLIPTAPSSPSPGPSGTARRAAALPSPIRMQPQAPTRSDSP